MTHPRVWSGLPTPLDVACVGSLGADCVAAPVLKHPAPGRLEQVERVGLYAGGSAANSGYGLLRLGIHAQVIGVVGHDPFGDFLIGQATRHGSATDLIRRSPHLATGATLVIVDEAGERTFLHAPGANVDLSPGDVPLGALRARGARVLHLAGYFILPGMEGGDGTPARTMFRHARQLGLTTSLDCVWDPEERWEDLIRPVLAETDLFYPNLAEGQAVTGASEPEEIVERLFALGVRDTVALTLGAQGCLVASRAGERVRVGAPTMVIVDTTGAGDAFIAGFLASRLRGLPLAQGARMATAAGALAVTALGPIGKLASWDEVQGLAGSLIVDDA